LPLEIYKITEITVIVDNCYTIAAATDVTQKQLCATSLVSQSQLSLCFIFITKVVNKSIQYKLSDEIE